MTQPDKPDVKPADKPQGRRAKIRRGKGEPSKPVDYNDNVVKLTGCPDCNGRGWFLINPFATGGCNGAGGLGNMTQCLTCLDSKVYYDEHGELPPEIASIITEAKQP